MDNWLISVAVRPLVAIAVLIPLIYLRRFLQRTMKDGRLKRFLLFRLS